MKLFVDPGAKSKKTQYQLREMVLNQAQGSKIIVEICQSGY